MERPDLEVADIFRVHGATWRQTIPLADAQTFADWLVALGQCEWVVYAKRPFAGPASVLSYLSRYTYRMAISNQRLVSMDRRGVTFNWKDYRDKGRTRYKTMTLEAHEFMRRFLLHVLPGGFHRIRHYGLLANAGRKDRLASVRALLLAPAPGNDAVPRMEDACARPGRATFVCRCCGAAMIIHDTFAGAQSIRAPPPKRGASWAHGPIPPRSATRITAATR